MSTMPKKPVIVDKWLHVPQDGYGAVYNYFPNRQSGGVQGKPEFIVLHIQEGSSKNSWGWFHIHEASSHVFANRDGSIWRLVEEKHGAWTNGDDGTPTETGKRLVALPGNSNLWTLTIETEGFPYEPNGFGWAAMPKPEAQTNAVVWQIVTWMKQYNIPIRNVLRHADVNQATRSHCPGDPFYAEVINRVRAITGDMGASPTYVSPQPITADGVLWDGKRDVMVNGLRFRAEQRTVHAARNGAYFRQWASRDASLTRGVIKPGNPIEVMGWVRGETVNKESRWWITKNYSRVHVLDTVERPGLPPAQPAEPDENPYDKVLNGVRFHAVRTDGKLREIQVAVDNLPVHKYATPLSEVLRAPLKRGAKFYAQFWVEGVEYAGDKRWWVTNNGARVPVSGTIEKP